MQLGNDQQAWGAVSVALHWLMALAIFGLLGVGLYMTGDTVGLSRKFELYQLHKSFGFTVMCLALVRLIWRLGQSAPRLPATMQGWEQQASRVSHGLLYLILFLMPLAGWVMSSASPLGIETVIFGLFTLPPLTSPSEAVEATAKLAHRSMAYLLMALLTLHMAAALWHHVVKRDVVLHRMLPWLPAPEKKEA